MSAPHHGRRFSLPSLVRHRVHKLKDVRRAKLEGRARTQHRRLSYALSVHEGIGVGAVRRHRHHTFAVHEVAVVRKDPRTEQLQTNEQKVQLVLENSALVLIQELQEETTTHKIASYYINASH